MVRLTRDSIPRLIRMLRAAGFAVQKDNGAPVCRATRHGGTVRVMVGQGWSIQPSYAALPGWWGQPTQVETLVKHCVRLVEADAAYDATVWNTGGKP